MKLIKVEDGNVEIQFDNTTLKLSALDAENLRFILEKASKIAMLQEQLKPYESALMEYDGPAIYLWQKGRKIEAIKKLREGVPGLMLAPAKYYLETCYKP